MFVMQASVNDRAKIRRRFVIPNYFYNFFYIRFYKRNYIVLYKHYNMIWNIRAIANKLGIKEDYQYNKLRLFLKGAKSEGDKELAKKVIALMEKETANLKKEIL